MKYDVVFENYAQKIKIEYFKILISYSFELTNVIIIIQFLIPNLILKSSHMFYRETKF